MTSSKAPSIHLPNLAKAIKAEEEESLAAFKPVQVPVGEDTGQSVHKMLENPDQAHITEKIYLFPESYNALRRELVYYWPNLWQIVAWPMAFQAEDFVAIMNEALDLKVQFDGNKVDATCKIYLDELRTRRGISRLN